MLQGWSCAQHHMKASYAVTLMFHVCAELPRSNSFVFIHIYRTAQDLCFECLSCFSYSLKGNCEKNSQLSNTTLLLGKEKNRAHGRLEAVGCSAGYFSLLSYLSIIPLICFSFLL